MPPKLDLRKTRPAAAPPPAANKPALPKFGMQLPTGVMLSEDQLAPDELAVYKSVGWTPGQPLVSLDAAMKEAHAAIAAVEAEMPQVPVAMPLEQKIENLPPERRKQVLAAFQATVAATEAADARRAKLVANAEHPSVNAAIEFALDAEGNEVQIEHAPPAEKPRADDDLATAASDRHVCRNCGYDNTNGKEPIEITETHKERFRQELLGGRFYEEYKLFGGFMRVTFRGLKRHEKELAIRQASYDDRDGKIPVAHEFMRAVFNYALCMALESLHIGEKLYSFPLIDEVRFDEKDEKGNPQTALHTFYDHVVSNIASANAISALTLAYSRFEELEKRVVAQMYNPDF